MFVDTHVHTAAFSPDSFITDSELNDFLHSNPNSLICTTEHYDYDYEYPYPEKPKICNIPKYREYYIKNKSLYEDTFGISYPVLWGVEFSYMDHLVSYYNNLSEITPFDSIICSVHSLNNLDLYFYRDVYLKSRKTVYSEYLKAIIDMLTSQSGFDIVGHFDYICRYAQFPEPYICYKDSPENFDEIFKLAINKSKAIELNMATSSLLVSKGNECYVHQLEILRRYRELGGELLTYGSDAHSIEKLFHSFGIASDLATNAGFKYFVYYKDRKPEYVKI